jgi:phosphotransferase family enzyme
MRPPRHVIAAFGANGSPELLPGGTGRSWRVGSLVIKPLDRAADELAWQAEVLASIERDGFRVARPLPTVVDGWTASDYLAGEHRPGRWREIIRVGERFHGGLAGLPRPDAIIDARADPWAVGDRVAWGEAPFPELDDVLSALKPVHAPSQLIHGDLTGNVLFHDELPPAILDFTPYWRPTEFASAIVVADALNWEGASDELAQLVEPQYLLRALVYRAVTTRLTGPAGPIPELDLARRIVASSSR